MATSTIKSPYQDLLLVDVAGTPHASYSEKFANLTSAYNNLSETMRARSYIRIGTSNYIYMGDGKYSHFQSSSEVGAYILLADVINCTLIGITITSSGTIDVANRSDAVLASRMRFLVLS